LSLLSINNFSALAYSASRRRRADSSSSIAFCFSFCLFNSRASFSNSFGRVLTWFLSSSSFKSLNLSFSASFFFFCSSRASLINFSSSSLPFLRNSSFLFFSSSFCLAKAFCLSLQVGPVLFGGAGFSFGFGFDSSLPAVMVSHFLTLILETFLTSSGFYTLLSSET
jgi:hypothetical protein